MKRHFFFRGKYLGSTEVGHLPPDFINSEMIGYAHFCPICSEVWAMSTVEGKATFPAESYCERHEPGERVGFSVLGAVPWWHVPGSMYISGRDDYNRTFPPELWNQEVIFHLVYASRFLSLPPHIASMVQDMLSCLLTRTK